MVTPGLDVRVAGLPMALMRPFLIPMSALTAGQWSRIKALVITVSATSKDRRWPPMPSRITLPPPNFTLFAVDRWSFSLDPQLGIRQAHPVAHCRGRTFPRRRGARSLPCQSAPMSVEAERLGHPPGLPSRRSRLAGSKRTAMGLPCWGGNPGRPVKIQGRIGFGEVVVEPTGIGWSPVLATGPGAAADVELELAIKGSISPRGS